MDSYHLACELVGHEDDVRGLCVINDQLIATASRDRTVRVWKLTDLPDSGYSSELISTLLGHTNFVSTVNWIPSNEEFSNGALVSGGMDACVMVWNIETAAIIHTLKGHELQVTDLAISKFGEIISSSVDRTIRIWKYGVCVNVLKGHESSVLSVISLPNGEIISGSGDCNVKIWRNYSCIKTLKSHIDSVRGLSTVHDIGFASASHDGTLKLWSESGDVILEMIGHTALVYSVSSSSLPSPVSSSPSPSPSSISSLFLCSGSEDNTVKIWKDGNCMQSIDHPGCIWSVHFLPRGEILTACSDGVVRVFSKDASKIAGKEVLENFEKKVEEKLKNKSVGGMNLNELPTGDSLNTPGRKNGETKIVREGNSAMAYSWNAIESKWEKIGSVVDGPENSNSKSIDGVTYDYIFDVDIGDGMPLRKLPYNNDQNPYDVAEKWLLRENLPESYKEQVVAFILQNSSRKNETISDQFFDPYTGAQAYVPGASNSNYSSNHSKKKSLKYLSQKEFLLFETAQFDGILKKLLEFNESFSSNPELSSHALSNDEVLRVKAIIVTLKNSDSNSFADVDFILLQRIMNEWPAQNIFPVFDVLRMMVLQSESASKKICENSFLDNLFFIIKKCLFFVPNQLTSLRLVANLCKKNNSKQFLLNNKNEIFDTFEPFFASENKNVRIAYSTLLYNFAILSIEKKDEVGQIQIYSKLSQVLTLKEIEAEVLFRSFFALGILIHSGCLKDMAAGDENLKLIISSFSQSSIIKVKEVCEDLASVLP